MAGLVQAVDRAHFFGGGAFYIFLLRQFFLTIPLDYDDAARIDGCGTFGVFLRIILPLSKPALGTMAIFTFMGQWNAFFEPLIYLNRFETQPLAVALTTWVQTAHGSTSMQLRSMGGDHGGLRR